MSLYSGASTCVINCEIGDDLSGQMYHRPCERIRDNLEANCLYLADDQTGILVVSLDLLALPAKDETQSLCVAIGKASGLPADAVILCCTHTHTGPELTGLLADTGPNRPYLERLRAWLPEAAREAVAQAREARVGWVAGQAHIGFNRRMCWADGTHTMYAPAGRTDFTGLEGPDDPRHMLLSVTDTEGRLIALVHNNACHATCVETACYASADFPGEARRLIREALNVSSLPVLYLQGASGDLSPWNMVGRRHYDREQRLKEVGALVAGETLRLLSNLPPLSSAPLRHAHEELTIGVRLPSAGDIKKAQAVVAQGLDKVGAVYHLEASVLRLYEEFKDNPYDTVPVHAVRIGDFAIATNPCEFYCQFGLDIRRRSPAKITAIAQLTDSFSGYCPTIYGLLGGGYSAETIYWCRLEPDAGYKIVNASARLLHQVLESADHREQQ